MTNNLIKTIFISSSFLILITGCSSHIQPKINHKNIGKNSLYVDFDKTTKQLQSISNIKLKSKGFRLNDLSQFGYNTKEKKETNWLFSGDESKNLYEEIKKTINEDDRKKLISAYDNLKVLQINSEYTINKDITKFNKKLLQQYNKYTRKYIYDKPQIKLQTIDKSRLYKDEKLPSNVEIITNKITKQSQLKNINYLSIVNDTFPCKSTNICIQNINKSKNKILEQLKNDKIKSKKRYMKQLKLNKKYLKDKTSYYIISNNKSILSKNFKYGDINKTINYHIEVEKIIKSNKKNLNTDIIIDNIDYTNIYPNYNNKNKDISIIFNNKTKSYKIENFRYIPIKIKSIALYFNNSIYDLSFSDENDNDYILELPPLSVTDIDFNDTLQESNHYKLKRHIAKKTFINFGFEIEYNFNNNSKNKILYKEIKRNIYKLIKDI